MLTWIFVQNIRKYLIMKKRNKMRVELEHWSYLLNKSVVTIETNSHWKCQIIVVNDCCKQIHDFVAIETHVIVLPFGVILAYATIPNSPLPTKWSNQLKWMVSMLDLNVKFMWTTTSMSPTWHVPICALFCAFKLVLFWSWKVQ